MTPDEATLGRLAGFVAQAAGTQQRRKPAAWHRALVDDADLGWALARRDVACACNRVRCVVLRYYRQPSAVPGQVVAVLRYLGVRLEVAPRE